MKCSNHHESDAIALCNLCCRGLCKDCVVFVKDSAACLNRCEAIVEVERTIRNRNFHTNKQYIDKVYPDEDLQRFEGNVTNYKAWLLFLLGVWGFLFYKFYNTPPAQNAFLLGLLCLLTVIIVGLISGLLRWRKLLIARRSVIDKWHAL